MFELRILNPLTNLLPPKIHLTKQPNMSKSIIIPLIHLPPSTFPSYQAHCKSAYRMTTEDRLRHSDDILGKIWKNKVHERLKLLLWTVGFDLLPVIMRLSEVFPLPSMECIFCGRHPETICHLLCRCDLAHLLWFQSLWGI